MASKADKIVDIVREEMGNNQVFAQNAFHLLDGRITVNDLVEKKLIQNVY